MTVNTAHAGLFITNEGDGFAMIEDEAGDIWWGFGHRLPEEFTAEVNRWLVHTNAATVPEDLFPVSQAVEHLWVRLDDPDRERFTVVNESTDAAFPVTRLMV